jgi:hypothetical protein
MKGMFPLKSAGPGMHYFTPVSVYILTTLEAIKHLTSWLSFHFIRDF